jgi:xanthosine utilization system XapX-like protein
MLKVNPVPIMLSGLVALLALFALLIVQFVVAFVTASSGSPAIVSIVGILAVLIGYLLLFGSYNVIAGRSAREQKVTVKESYAIAFKRFIGALALLIICVVLYILTSILLILPGIYFAARASLAFFVFYEEDLSAVKALKRSFELTKGHAIEMLGAVVASALLGGGSGLLSGAISLSPLVGRYHDLKQLKESGAPKPKVHYLNWVTVIVVFLIMAAYIGFVAYAVHSVSSLNGSNSQFKDSFSSGGSSLNSSSDPFSSSGTSSGSSSSTDPYSSTYSN